MDGWRRPKKGGRCRVAEAGEAASGREDGFYHSERTATVNTWSPPAHSRAVPRNALSRQRRAGRREMLDCGVAPSAARMPIRAASGTNRMAGAVSRLACRSPHHRGKLRHAL